jgi:hypothetical protein
MKRGVEFDYKPYRAARPGSRAGRWLLIPLAVALLFSGVLAAAPAPTLADDIDDLEVQVIAALNAALTQNMADLQAIAAKIAESNAEKRALRDVDDALRAMDSELQSLLEANRTLDAQIALFTEAVADARSDRDPLEEKIKQLQEQIDRMKEAAEKLQLIAAKMEELLPELMAFLGADANDEDAAQARLVAIRAHTARLIAAGPPKLVGPEPTSTPTPRAISTPRTVPVGPPGLTR